MPPHDLRLTIEAGDRVTVLYEPTNQHDTQRAVGEVVHAEVGNLYFDEEGTDRELHLEGEAMLVQSDGDGYRDDRIGHTGRIVTVEKPDPLDD